MPAASSATIAASCSDGRWSAARSPGVEIERHGPASPRRLQTSHPACAREASGSIHSAGRANSTTVFVSSCCRIVKSRGSCWRSARSWRWRANRSISIWPTRRRPPRSRTRRRCAISSRRASISSCRASESRSARSSSSSCEPERPNSSTRSTSAFRPRSWKCSASAASERRRPRCSSPSTASRRSPIWSARSRRDACGRAALGKQDDRELAARHSCVQGASAAHAACRMR